MKTYRYPHYYRGIHLDLKVVCRSLARASELFGVMGSIRKYCSILPAEDLPPEKVFAEFEYSGEAGYFLPKDQFRVWMPHEEAKALIDEHRKICPTYQYTLKKYPR